MTNKKFRALGKGLSSLIPNKLEFTTYGSFYNALTEIPINKIINNTDQPRKSFNKNEILELSKSIKSYGILQPILVKKVEDDKYQIIAGERRYRAAQIANLNVVPAIIKNIIEKENFEISLIENIQREELHPIEEANIYKKLIDEKGYTQLDLAEKIGKSRSYVANLIRLLNLPKKFQNLLSEDELSAGHARLLLNHQNPDEIVQTIRKNKLSVRQTEKLIQNTQPNHSKTRKDQDIMKLERKIYQTLNLTTKITLGSKENSIVIKFSTMDEFDYLVSLLCANNRFNI